MSHVQEINSTHTLTQNIDNEKLVKFHFFTSARMVSVQDEDKFYAHYNHNF